MKLRVFLLGLIMSLVTVIPRAEAAKAPVSFAAVIVDENSHAAISGASMDLVRVKPARPQVHRKLVADRDGKVQAAITPGVYRYRIDAKGYLRSDGRLDLPAANHPLLLSMYKEAAVTGRLLDEQGKPVARLPLLIGSLRGVSDGAGVFRITGLDRGRHEMKSGHRTLVLQHNAVFSMSPGEERDLGDLTVIRGGAVALAIVGREDGKEVNLPRLRFYLNAKQGNREATTDAKGRVLVEALAPGTYAVNCYDERVLELTPKEIEVREGEQVRLRIEAEMRPPEVSLERIGGVLLPEKAVQVRVRGYRASRARVTLSALDPQSIASAGFEVEETPQIREEIETFEVPLKRPGQSLHTRGSFMLPPLKPGAYLLQVDHRSAKQKSLRSPGARTAASFLVTRLALVTKNSPTATLIYAADLATGKPLTGVEIGAYPLAGKGFGTPLFQVTTGADGLASVAAPPAATRYVGRWQESYAKVEVATQGGNEAGPLQGYIYTDRPAYRPAQTVFFKGILRQRDGEGLLLPKPGKVLVKVTDTNDQSVMEKELTTSASGAFHGEFVLDGKPPLGNYTISAGAGAQSWQAGFKVLEYRKPEFEVTATAPEKFVLSGDKSEVRIAARYYFGAPVTGAKVKYRTYSRELFPYEGDDAGEYEEGGDEEYRGYADLIGEGEVRTDGEGNATIPLETGATKVALAYTVEVEVTDASSRQVAGSANFAVVPALINVTVRSNSYIARPGQPVEMTVKAATWDGTPVKAAFQVKVEEQVHDKKRQITSFRPVDTLPAATDATGAGTFRYTFPRPGNWRFTAATTDRRGREAAGEGWVWAWQEGYAWDSSWRQLGLVFDKKSYRPGETAQLLVKNPEAGGYLLLSIEGREIYSRRLMPLSGGVEVIELPVPKEYSPYVFVSAGMVRNGRFYSRTRKLTVDDKPGLLTVAVTPDKPLYSPGDHVRLKMRVSGTDQARRPGELSVGVVDEAIYAIARGRGDDIYTAFRGNRDHLVSTIHSFPRVYLGGAAKDDRSAAADRQPPNRVRRVFKDTAYWIPVVETADGTATAEFDLPDNLTTWRATAIGHNAASEFGTGTAKFISRLDVMARLLPPRFLVQGDEVRIPAMVNNATEQEREVTGIFSVKGLTLAGDPTFKGIVPANGSLRRDLPVRAPTAGEAMVRLDAGAGGKGDAMELAVPVLPRGLKRQAVGNVILRGSGTGAATLELPAQAFTQDATLTIDFAPSLAAILNQGVRELVQYPYGCVEQTMSRFVPAVLVKRLAQARNWPVDKELEEMLPEVLEAGLSRLYDFQHDDGGWGWWKEDRSDVTMTANVLHGMGIARAAGVAVRDDVYLRGMKSLEGMLPSARTSQLPYAYRALTMGNGADAGVEGRIERHWRELQPSEQLLYIEALLHKGDKERAERLLGRVKSRVQRDGDAAWLQDDDSDSWWYSERWSGSTVETTALLLETVVSLNRDDPLAGSLAEFLLRKRAGRWWQTTRATATVIKALADYGGETGDYTAKILLNGREIDGVKVEAGRLSVGQAGMVVPARELQRGTNRIELQKSGTGGVAHLAAVLDYVMPPEMITTTHGLKIQRQLFRVLPRRDGSSWRLERKPLRPDEKVTPGEEIEVSLVIDNGKHLEYVIVEDPLPAGFEVKGTAGGSRFTDYSEWDWYTHRERHDERMAFFISSLPAGQHEFHYLVSPQVEGKMLALPASVWPMYQPSTRSESAPWEATVVK